LRVVKASVAPRWSIEKLQNRPDNNSKKSVESCFHNLLRIQKSSEEKLKVRDKLVKVFERNNIETLGIKVPSDEIVMSLPDRCQTIKILVNKKVVSIATTLTVNFFSRVDDDTVNWIESDLETKEFFKHNSFRSVPSLQKAFIEHLQSNITSSGLINAIELRIKITESELEKLCGESISGLKSIAFVMRPSNKIDYIEYELTLPTKVRYKKEEERTGTSAEKVDALDVEYYLRIYKDLKQFAKQNPTGTSIWLSAIKKVMNYIEGNCFVTTEYAVVEIQKILQSTLTVAGADVSAERRTSTLDDYVEKIIPNSPCAVHFSLEATNVKASELTVKEVVQMMDNTGKKKR
jgi:hypothetical protein